MVGNLISIAVLLIIYIGWIAFCIVLIKGGFIIIRANGRIPIGLTNTRYIELSDDEKRKRNAKVQKIIGMVWLSIGCIGILSAIVNLFHQIERLV